MIRLELAEDHPALPSARTIRRHLHVAALQPAPAGRPRLAEHPLVPRATLPHQGWQIDACEALRLRSGQRVCWLRVVDECSGAFLKTLVFAAARWEHVDRHHIQEGFRQIFTCWGLPAWFRADNGFPWGSTGDFPPEMALWLIGLGSDVLWIPPGRPQHNGVVERAQGTGQNWFEPQTCDQPAELQRRCDALDRRQRECYPYRDGRSRWAVYPALGHAPRSYSRRWEQRAWDLRRALAAVAGRVVPRQVDCSGSVSVYHHTRYVGKPYIGQQVYIALDPSGPTWVFADAAGNQLRTQEADELTAERIRTLWVTARKGKS
jgi:hypothetical protein